jgi:hypothetical protein
VAILLKKTHFVINESSLITLLLKRDKLSLQLAYSKTFHDIVIKHIKYKQLLVCSAMFMMTSPLGRTSNLGLIRVPVILLVIDPSRAALYKQGGATGTLNPMITMHKTLDGPFL